MIERTVTISGREEDVATVLRLLKHMEYLGNVGRGHVRRSWRLYYLRRAWGVLFLVNPISFQKRMR